MDTPANDPLIDDCASSYVRMMRLHQYREMHMMPLTFPELDHIEIAVAHEYALAQIAGIAQLQ